MASYKLLIKPSAAKEIESLSKKDRQRIVSRIQTLVTEPRPVGCTKLSGQEQYRIRQGDYRILYEIHDREHVVTVVRVGHRRDMYR